MMRQNWIAFLLAALALTALVFFLTGSFPGVLADPEGRDNVIAAVVWAMLPISALVVMMRRRPGGIAAFGLVWLALGAVLLTGYTYRYQVQDIGRRLVSELVPSLGTGAGGEMVFRADRNGQFSVQAKIDGVEIRFLVDTGATDVVLSLQDARRVGLDPATLRFTQPYRTANGVVMGASIRLDEITLGDIRLEDVAASVNPVPMAHSLLGMSFLGRLSSYEITRDTLTMRQ